MYSCRSGRPSEHIGVEKDNAIGARVFSILPEIWGSLQCMEAARMPFVSIRLRMGSRKKQNSVIYNTEKQ